MNLSRRSTLFYAAIAIALVLFPFIVGWLTGDSPYGVNGRPVGRSVYWQGMLIETFILAILAISYNLLFGFAGVISFGHALFFGLGSYVLGICTDKIGLNASGGLLVGIVAALVICGGLGVLIGLVSLRLRGVYFAMFTLAVAEMFAIFFSRLAATGAEDGFTISLPGWLNPVGNRLAFYYVALALCALTYLFVRRLIGSPFGSVLLAIRENEARAQAIGYNTLMFKLLAIGLAGMLAAVAGMLQVIYNRKVDPGSLSIAYTVDPLLMTIIGGIGTFSGPVIGAAGLHLSDRLLRDAQLKIGEFTVNIGASWTLILGIAFIVVVIVFPQGISQLWLPHSDGQRSGLLLRFRTGLLSRLRGSNWR
jgi:branched-chain amino acid transport system permease protein